MIDGDAVTARFDLGRATCAPSRVHGGQLNRLWRLDTDRGSFAVKELNLDRGWTLRTEDVLRLELAAFTSGVPMPEPMPDPSTGCALAVVGGASVLVHRWVDGARVPEDAPVPADFAHRVGRVLATIHALDVEWSPVSIADPMPTESDWRSLADRAIACGMPWATELAAAVRAFGKISAWVDAGGRPEPMVLTHKDIGQKNLLVRADGPVVLDWETSGILPLACELGQTAHGLARGELLDSLRPEVFRAVLDGYVDGGGVLPEPGPHWFLHNFSGWMWFVRWNAERCLAGVEPAKGPSLAVAHDVVTRGLRELPAMIAKLDDLAALTVR